MWLGIWLYTSLVFFILGNFRKHILVVSDKIGSNRGQCLAGMVVRTRRLVAFTIGHGGKDLMNHTYPPGQD